MVFTKQLNIMEQSIFESVLKSCTAQSDYSENEISFMGSVGEYHIHFYSKEPFKVLRTHEFGYTFKGEWVEDKPTPYQVKQMMQLIQLEISDYEKYKDDEQRENENHNDERPYIDFHDYFGVSRKDFI